MQQGPDDAEITVGLQDTAADAAQQILAHLEQQAFLGPWTVQREPFDQYRTAPNR
jgi:hypothetical protein